MSRTFECRVCHREIVVNFLKAGETARCKHCGSENVVPLSDQVNQRSDDRELETGPGITMKSLRTSRGLLTFLWIQLGMDILLFLLAYITRGAFTPLGQDALGQALVIVVVISTLVSIITLVVFFVWLLDLHRDLARLYEGYAVTPSRAFVRLLIPLYNLWGTWNVFETMVRTFQEDSDELRKSGTTLYSWLIVMYSALVLSYLYVGEKAVSAFHPEETISYRDLFSGWDLFGIMLAIVTLIAYIGMTQTISLALDKKSDSLGSTVPNGMESQITS